MAAKRRITHAGALEKSLAAADPSISSANSRYRASVELARYLARKMDEIEASGGLNAAGKPDTATPGQYLRALEAIGLTPSKAEQAPKRDAQAPARRPLSSFRTQRFREVV